MRFIGRVIFCGLLGSLLGSAFSEQTLRLTGTVLNPKNLPVEGATVYLLVYVGNSQLDQEREFVPQKHQATTDAKGRFVFELPRPTPPYWMTLIATHPDYAFDAISAISYREQKQSEQESSLKLRLSTPTFLEGRVLTKERQPLANAKVRVARAGREDGFVRILEEEAHLLQLSASTDSEGWFRLGPFPPNYKLGFVVEHPDYWYRGDRKYFSSKVKNLILTVVPAGTIKGRVVFEDGRPGAHLTVKCARLWSNEHQRTTTDAEGNFLFTGLGRDPYFLHVLPDEKLSDWVSERLVVYPAEGEKLVVPDLKLIRGVLLKGKVTERGTGRPLPNIRIESQLQQRIQQVGGFSLVPVPGPTAQTDKQGVFQLRLPPGQWRIYPQVFSDTPYLLDQEVWNVPLITVSPEGIEPLHFELIRGIPLKGEVVLPNGKPAVKATVSVIAEWRQEEWSTNEKGRFEGRTSFHPDHPVSLYALSGDRKYGASVDLLPRKRPVVRLRLRSLPALKGAVTDRQGKPIAGARVEVQIFQEENQFAETLHLLSLNADRHGRFTLYLIPRLRYRVLVTAEGFGSDARYPVEIGETKSLRFALHRANKVLEGLVTDQEGNPLAGAAVWVARTVTIGNRIYYEDRHDTSTDDQGRFRFALSPGRWWVWCFDEEMGLGEDQVEQAVWVDSKATKPVQVKLTLQSRQFALQPPSPPAIGTSAPPLQIAHWVNGAGTEDPNKWRGKTVVLLFAASYLPAAEPYWKKLHALQERMKQQGRENLVLMAILDASLPPEEVAQFIQEKRIAFPVGIVKATANLGWDSPSFRAYGITALPTLVVIDPQGVVQAINPTLEELDRL